ncbi:hypothetical protein J2D73_16170 [Acetobacter sacchari]|uniref:Uncharacterized protein n=1 Tax=Acetobacter sacchari TaxID=2661687 RepID=A0ABS3LZJ3_9PROT|nr:hypothetical protein [Acetobacter sacchari]MBO1361324.1 hypothetical protein [Acetobacter sacchari]
MNIPAKGIACAVLLALLSGCAVDGGQNAFSALPPQAGDFFIAPDGSTIP